MAGIFESQIMQGSSLRGESFTHQTAVADNSELIKAVGEGIQTIDNTLAYKKAVKEAGAVEDSFLESSEANRADLAERDELNKIDPSQGKVYDDAVKRIKQIDETINMRGVNPAVAMSRRDSILSRAMARAPMFKEQLRAYSGSKTTAFEEETKQMIKETNAVRDDMTSRGFRPDLPSHQQAYSELMAASRNAKYVTDRTVIDSATAAAEIQPLISEYLNTHLRGVDTIVAGNLNNLANLPLEKRQELVVSLQGYINGNEQNIVNSLLRNLDVDPRFVDQKTKENAALSLTGRVKSIIAAADGKVPMEMANYELEYSKDQVMLSFKENYPGSFTFIPMAPFIKDTPAGTAMSNVAANDLMDFMKQRANGKLLTQSEMRGRGTEDPKATQKVYAEGRDNSMKSWMKADNLDPNLFDPYMKEVINDLNSMAANPREYSPAMFDKQIARLNDKVYMDWFEKQSPILAQQYADGVKRSMVEYAGKSMAYDINKQMNKSDGGLFNTRDLVNPVIDKATGSIIFVAKSFPDEGPQTKAIKRAEELNGLYKSRMDLIKTTASNYGDLRDATEQAHFMQLMFSDIFKDIGNPIRSKTEDYGVTRSKILAKTLKMEGAEKFLTYSELADVGRELDKEKRFNKELEDLDTSFKSNIGSTQDVFGSIIEEVISGRENKLAQGK